MLHIDAYEPPSPSIQPPSPILIFKGLNNGDHHHFPSSHLHPDQPPGQPLAWWPGTKNASRPSDRSSSASTSSWRTSSPSCRLSAAGSKTLGTHWESWGFIGKSCPLNYGPTIQVSELRSFTQNDVNIQENLWHHRHGMTEIGEKMG